MTYLLYQTNLHMNIKISVWICKIKSKFEWWIFITFNGIWIKHCLYLIFEGITLVSCDKFAGADLLNITSLNVILSQFPGHKFRAPYRVTSLIWRPNLISMHLCGTRCSAVEVTNRPPNDKLMTYKQSMVFTLPHHVNFSTDYTNLVIDLPKPDMYQ